MKGIILAGGGGTRLHPSSKVICKPLLPIYDKPMIYYPLSVLMLAGIREVLILSNMDDVPRFESLLGDGSQLGMTITVQGDPSPKGTAYALTQCTDFVGNDNLCVIYGDNVIYGDGLEHILRSSVDKVEKNGGGILFGYYVNNPQRYGVVEFDNQGNVVSIEEKPEHPKSNYAIMGLYLYENAVLNSAKNVEISPRGEYEITAVHQEYQKKGLLSVNLMSKGFTWLDTGTHDSMLEAANFVKMVDDQLGIKIGCIEEIAYKNGWISSDQLHRLAQPLLKSGYGEYLIRLIK